MRITRLLAPLAVATLAVAVGSARAATITEFPSLGSGSGPSGIVGSSGGNGTLWFAESGSNALASMTLSGTVSAYGGFTHPDDVVVAPTGDVWATEPSANKIAYRSANGTVQHEFSTDSGGLPNAIAVGPNGGIWIAQAAPNELIRINTQGTITGQVTLDGNPAGVTSGPDGNLWVTELTSPAEIQRVATSGTGTVTATYTLRSSDAPTAIVAGGDGALWFADQGTPPAIGRIDPATGAVTRDSSGLAGIPTALALGPDDDLWFTQTAVSAPTIGRLFPATGTAVGYTAGLPSASAPNSIAAGLDGNLWFTDSGTDAIGKLVIGPIGAHTMTAANVTRMASTLQARVTPNGWPTTYHFEYGTSTSYGHSVPASDEAIPDSDAGVHVVTESVTGLTPGTTYHYRIIAATAQGTPQTVDGGDQTFTTAAPPASTSTTPTATTTKPTSTTKPTTTTTTTTTTTATPTTTSSSTAATPVAGRTAVAGAVTGTVYVTPPGSSTPVALGAQDSIPLGAVVDASHGVVKVTNALRGARRTQSATVWAGRFTMSQDHAGRTMFRLVDAPSCTNGRHAHTARRRSVKLWAHDHHGRYGTHGRNSVATVRGTEWETIESCAGTRTVVREGTVSVRDTRTHRSKLVRAGHSLLARP